MSAAQRAGERDAERGYRAAHLLKRRCDLARRRALAAVRAARLSVDRAQASVRVFDDDAADSDVVLDVDHALGLVVGAHRRCEQIVRRCVGVAARFDVRDAERFAVEAEREAKVADRFEKELRGLVRDSD